MRGLCELSTRLARMLQVGDFAPVDVGLLASRYIMELNLPGERELLPPQVCRAYKVPLPRTLGYLCADDI